MSVHIKKTVLKINRFIKQFEKKLKLIFGPNFNFKSTIRFRIFS